MSEFSYSFWTTAHIIFTLAHPASAQVYLHEAAPLEFPTYLYRQDPLVGRIAQRSPPLFSGVISVEEETNDAKPINFEAQKYSSSSASSTSETPLLKYTDSIVQENNLATVRAKVDLYEKLSNSSRNNVASDTLLARDEVAEDDEEQKIDYRFVITNCNIIQCNAASVCKVVDREAKCLPIIGPKPGYCPKPGDKPKAKDDSSCTKLCSDDQECADDMKCCQIACAKSCNKPSKKKKVIICRPTKF